MSAAVETTWRPPQCSGCGQTGAMPARLPIRMWGEEKDAVPIEWEDVERRLRDAIAYWVVVTTGRARPVWGVWHDDRLLLSIGSTAVSRGIANSPRVSAHLEDAHDVIIVEGSAAWMSDESVLAPFCDVYNAKYRWDFTVGDMPGGILEMRPDVVLAWRAGAYTDAKTDRYPLAASRFVFG